MVLRRIVLISLFLYVVVKEFYDRSLVERFLEKEEKFSVSIFSFLLLGT